jgi:hypothetical protein
MQSLGGAHRYLTASTGDRAECRVVSEESDDIVIMTLSFIGM